MVGELDVLNEWIPEQMQPGTVFVLENAGEIGEKEDPLLGGSVVPILRHAWPDYTQTDQWLAAGYLRIGAMFGAVFYP